jgi:hypothetical protein
MSSGNRTVKYENLLKSLRKHYKPLAEPPERSVLEHLLYACCLEDARVEQADEGFAKLQQTYFDWNEVRVTTAVELAEALKPLPFPMQAASRIKQCLQSIFETRYQYDIDDMKKANLGKATAELEAWKGMSAFVVSYVSQHALGGHSIPASQLICEAMWQCDVLSLAEIQKKALPGIERAIPKNKGVEFAGLMHQFASELYHHPKGTTPLAVLKEMGATYKTKPKADDPAATTKTKGSTAKAAPAAPASSAGKEKESETKKPADTAAATSKAVAGVSTSKGKEEVKPPKTVPTAKASGSERVSGKESKAKEVPTASKAASKSAESAKELKPKETKPSTKPAAKPSSSKSPSIKSDPAKADKGSKGKVEKGKSDTSRSDKAKSDKGKADKGKSDKAKSTRSNVAKGKPEISKSDKSKPVKKESKGIDKPNKGQSKGSQGSVGRNLTKKKPR